MAWHRAPAGGRESRLEGLRTFWKLAAPHALYDLVVSLALWEQKTLQRWAEGAECRTG